MDFINKPIQFDSVLPVNLGAPYTLEEERELFVVVAGHDLATLATLITEAFEDVTSAQTPIDMLSGARKG